MSDVGAQRRMSAESVRSASIGTDAAAGYDLRAKPNFASRFKLIWVVQSPLAEIFRLVDR
jgi:hypothetical protein